MTDFRLVVLPGDGIGPEIVDVALAVLDVVGERFGHSFARTSALAGGAAWEETGQHLPVATVQACRAAQAVVKGPFGGPTDQMHHPKWSETERVALLGLRREFDLFINLRPVRVLPELAVLSPLRPEMVEGTDLLIVRELAGGIYFGERGERRAGGQRVVWDTESYAESEVARICEVAFEHARRRRGLVTLVGKSNILDTSLLWRDVFAEVAAGHPDIRHDYLHVDNAAMQIVSRPRQFDVIVTTNLFGDILSDEAAVLAGSLGMLGSASLNAAGFGLYEPVHGSAPDLAGTGRANPIGMVTSVAMMLRHSFELAAEADAVDAAIRTVLAAGARTSDIARANDAILSCSQMGAELCRAVAAPRPDPAR